MVRERNGVWREGNKDWRKGRGGESETRERMEAESVYMFSIMLTMFLDSLQRFD